MDKMFELFETLANNKVSKIEIKKRLKGYVKGLDKALDFLKTVDPDKFVDSLAENTKSSALKAYAEGKISEVSVEAARKINVIGGNEATQAIYDLNKKAYEFCKEMTQQAPPPSS